MSREPEGERLPALFVCRRRPGPCDSHGRELLVAGVQDRLEARGGRVGCGNGRCSCSCCSDVPVGNEATFDRSQFAFLHVGQPWFAAPSTGFISPAGRPQFTITIPQNQMERRPVAEVLEEHAGGRWWVIRKGCAPAFRGQQRSAQDVVPAGIWRLAPKNSFGTPKQS